MFLIIRPYSWARLTTFKLAQKPLRRQHTETHKENSSNKVTFLSRNKDKQQLTTNVRPIGERIKENTKMASYLGVITLGATITGFLFYAIFMEFWSPNSANNIYSAALNLCINDYRIQDTLGQPIIGYGEETRRRRRQHVAHTIFVREGVEHMQMQFYIKGIRNKATVSLEMKKNLAGIYDYRYLFAQLNHYPKTTIILKDNRHKESAVK